MYITCFKDGVVWGTPTETSFQRDDPDEITLEGVVTERETYTVILTRGEIERALALLNKKLA